MFRFLFYCQDGYHKKNITQSNFSVLNLKTKKLIRFFAINNNQPEMCLWTGFK